MSAHRPDRPSAAVQSRRTSPGSSSLGPPTNRYRWSRRDPTLPVAWGPVCPLQPFQPVS